MKMHAVTGFNSYPYEGISDYWVVRVCSRKDADELVEKLNNAINSGSESVLMALDKKYALSGSLSSTGYSQEEVDVE